MASQDDVLREVAAMYGTGVRRFRAGMLAERLWPGQRTHNSKGQVFPLGAAVAARLLRSCLAVRELEPRRWVILPHRLPPVVELNGHQLSTQKDKDAHK